MFDYLPVHLKNYTENFSPNKSRLGIAQKIFLPNGSCLGLYLCRKFLHLLMNLTQPINTILL
uniref:Uncharacterized protein n=1 Tax=Arundo donax TaxID=35708 RepID=A0A0A9D3B3_ARUDO